MYGFVIRRSSATAACPEFRNEAAGQHGIVREQLIVMNVVIPEDPVPNLVAAQLPCIVIAWHVGLIRSPGREDEFSCKRSQESQGNDGCDRNRVFPHVFPRFDGNQCTPMHCQCEEALIMCMSVQRATLLAHF